MGSDYLYGGSDDDYFMYETSADGATAGSSYGYDYIGDFASGDTIGILSGSTLDTAIDDNSADDSITFVTPSGGYLSGAPLDATNEALYLDTTLTDGSSYYIDDYSAWSPSTLATMINGLINSSIITGWSASSSGDDGLIVVAGDTISSIYYYLEDGGNTTGTYVESSELSLLVNVDYVLDSTEVVIV